jgi:hypothetical protein
VLTQGIALGGATRAFSPHACGCGCGCGNNGGWGCPELLQIPPMLALGFCGLLRPSAYRLTL